MIKIYLEGFGYPYSVVGKYITEDERFIILDDGGIKKKIPQRRVVFIEDLSEVFAQNMDSPSETKEVVVKAKPKRPMTPEKLKDFISSAASKEEATVATEQRMKTLNVVMTGVVDKNFEIEVPEKAFVPDTYTAALSKYVSSNLEVKSTMDGGVIFDGPPKVSGPNIYIKTRRLEDKVSASLSKMGLASKVATTVGNFSQPQKNYDNEFSMMMNDDFAIKESPFNAQVKLKENDDEALDENSGEEAANSQEQDNK